MESRIFFVFWDEEKVVYQWEEGSKLFNVIIIGVYVALLFLFSSISCMNFFVVLGWECIVCVDGCRASINSSLMHCKLGIGVILKRSEIV